MTDQVRDLLQQYNLSIVPYNPNPKGYKLMDCAVRACSKASGLSYQRTQRKMNRISLELCTPYTTTPVISKFLYQYGYRTLWYVGKDPEHFHIKDILKRIPDKGTLLIESEDHIAFIKDRVIYDYFLEEMFDIWIEDLAIVVRYKRNTLDKCLFCPCNPELYTGDKDPYYLCTRDIKPEKCDYFMTVENLESSRDKYNEVVIDQKMKLKEVN